MNILTQPDLSHRRIAAIGMYDGVHRGHRLLLDFLCAEGRKMNLSPAAVTFRHHPLAVVDPQRMPLLLTLTDDRLRLLEKAGVDDCILLDFSDELRTLPARSFMALLHEDYAIDALVVGFDSRFGHNRAEGLTQYRAFGAELGMQILEAPRLELPGLERISSSAIRTFIANGDMKSATRALGRPFSISGRVVSGKALGRKLGFPTANILPEAYQLIPPEGVYAVEVVTPERLTKRGVANIGHRPTVDLSAEAPLSIEVHILDYEGNLYGATLKVGFLERLRREQRFSSEEELRHAILTDIRNASAVFT